MAKTLCKTCVHDSHDCPWNGSQFSETSGIAMRLYGLAENCDSYRQDPESGLEKFADKIGMVLCVAFLLILFPIEKLIGMMPHSENKQYIVKGEKRDRPVMQAYYKESKHK